MLLAIYNHSLKLFCLSEVPVVLYFIDTAAWGSVFRPLFRMSTHVLVINTLDKLTVHISLTFARDVHIHSVMCGVQLRREIKWSELTHDSLDSSLSMSPYSSVACHQHQMNPNADYVCGCVCAGARSGVFVRVCVCVLVCLCVCACVYVLVL
jgi:hypothetical protein